MDERTPSRVDPSNAASTDEDPASVNLHDYPPVTYYPFTSGTYEVGPGLYKFGHDFGNGPADDMVFQIDRQFDDYRDAKLEARQQDLQGHVLTQEYSQDVAGAIVQFIAGQLANENPSWFTLSERDDGLRTLGCELTSELLAHLPRRNWLRDSVSAITLGHNGLSD